MTNNSELPLIAVRDIVLFPGTIVPLFIGRIKSVNALNEGIDQKNIGSYALFSTQKKHEDEDPKIKDIYHTGVLCKIIQVIKLPNNNSRVLIKVEERVVLNEIKEHEDKYFIASYSLQPDRLVTDLDEVNKLIAELLIKFTVYIKSNKKLNQDILTSISPDQKNPGHIVNIMLSHVSTSVQVRQKILEILDINKRAKELLKLLVQEIGAAETEQYIESKLEKQIKKEQKEYYLHKKVQMIQKELGSDQDKEMDDLEKKIKTLNLSKEAKEKATSELKKLKMLNPSSSESGIIRTYLDTLLAMPWGVVDKSMVDTKKAAKILDKDHYGLEKVKERILEYLAVLKRAEKIAGPILCFVGPPGVGKTSLVKSISESISRKYAKFSLGGVRDEAEIRGHRKTYVGAMPGKIINLLKKSKTDNPVILLDEIDKMSSDFRGDPASALLEVLDPEQNSKFADHYLEVEYDLSKVVFIATSNSFNIPRPLLDRMEVIRLYGYIEDEKFHIAKDHLIPKQLKNHNVKLKEFSIDDEVIYDLIRYYTRESGVRDLERQIAALIRKSLKKIIEGETKSVNITSKDLESYLGIRKYKIGLAEKSNQIGATTGLAYTEVGGELLTIEAVSVDGKGEIKATGKLGEVMKESTQTAYSCFCANSDEFGIKISDIKSKDIHIHFPEGATPKDGPSAGIAIFTTIVSLMTHIPVKRTVAMTGEITLRGNVLPIGGLREKLLAALRGGIKTVIIPEENVPDLKDIPKSIVDNLEIIPASKVLDVIKIALTQNPVGTNGKEKENDNNKDNNKTKVSPKERAKERAKAKNNKIKKK